MELSGEFIFSVFVFNWYTPVVHSFIFLSSYGELGDQYEQPLLQFVTVFYSYLQTGVSLRSLGVELHCRCIQTESRPIGRHIEKVELIPANSHCEETEIM